MGRDRCRSIFQADKMIHRESQCRPDRKISRYIENLSLTSVTERVQATEELLARPPKKKAMKFVQIDYGAEK